AGPGKLIVYLLPREPSLELEMLSQGTQLMKDTLAAAPMSGLVEAGAKRGGGFVPGGLKRVMLELLPKLRSYEVRVNVPSAVAAYRIVQAPPGVRVPEVPIKPDGKARPIAFVSKEKWHWASICERVTVTVAQAGTLHVSARTALGGGGDLPPPTFIRAVAEGRVRAAFPITAAPEPGLEFISGNGRFEVGTLRTQAIPLRTPGEYDFELAAWGCINGVGLQFDFAPGAAPEGSTESPLLSATGVSGGSSGVASAQLAGLSDAGASGETLAQCGLQIDDLARNRALEYLDTMVASGVIPPSQLALQQDVQLGGSFALQSVWYALDGNTVFQKEAMEDGTTALVQRRVVPGPHTLEVKATLRGRGAGPFNYLNEYVIRVAKREAFVAESGKKYALKVTLLDKGGFNTPFKERPGVKVELLPATN
ncbi:MAG TPA: hypothetical protein VH208_02275, partial [Myxococcaceae bacterium]|nr:hypothetical protein [Myxococcaceae bacterium]